MKKINLLLLLLLSAGFSFTQVACSGTGLVLTEGVTAHYPSGTIIGNGAAGTVRICITTNGLTPECGMGSTRDRLIVQESDGNPASGLAILDQVNNTDGAICITTTTASGYIELGWLSGAKGCAISDVTLSWDTFAADGVTSLCCTMADCGDGIQNGCETGIDCGGGCVSTCSGTASCTDNILNQDETAIDCGGTICPACGAACTTWSGGTMTPAAGSIVDASASDQTITTCTSATYNNSGNNWLHGVYMDPSSTGFVSSNATGSDPEATVKVMGVDYKWSNQTANFTGNNSGNSITANGWFVETSTVNGNPGNNLGWPLAAGNTMGPMCFTTTVSCSGLSGDIAASLNFTATSDSYSGSWTNSNCGLETSSGASSLAYTLRCPVSTPIELMYLKGDHNARTNILKWATASETDNDYFIVYRSPDNGLSWEELDRVDGAPEGNSTTQRNYEAYDENPNYDITYYKLRQVDFNGDISESDVIGIITPHYFEGLKVLPNPVVNIASVVFKSSEKATTKITVSDVSGKVLYSNEYFTDYGLNSYDIETANYTKGLYFVNVSNSYDSKKLKFVKD